MQLTPESVAISVAKKTFLKLSKEELLIIKQRLDESNLYALSSESFYPQIKHMIKLKEKFHDLTNEGFLLALSEKLAS